MISALVLLPVVILTILKGSSTLFASLVAVLSAIGMDEFYRMALPKRCLERYIAVISSALLVFVPLSGNPSIITSVYGLAIILLSLLFLFRIDSIEHSAKEVSYAVIALIYVPFLLMHLVQLRLTPYGIQWLFVIMLIVMTNDSAAYYCGSAFGKHRLYELVSPKKSIEGAVGGLFGSLAGTFIAKFTFFPQLSFADAVITALVIGMIGQAGDLFESLLKRSFGVKDSGSIIPGHGGVLDRLDSIIFAAPVTYYYVLFFFKG